MEPLYKGQVAFVPRVYVREIAEAPLWKWDCSLSFYLHFRVSTIAVLGANASPKIVIHVVS